MSQLPGTLSRERALELAGRTKEPWIRRGVVALLLAFVAAGLAGVFGQDVTTTTAAGPDAALRVEAPPRLRGGLLAQGTITVQAARRIAEPRLVLGDGWVDGITINTISPEPVAQGERGGRLVLSYDPLPASDRLTVRIELQVNPTTVGERSQDVELHDGEALLARARRSLVVFP